MSSLERRTREPCLSIDEFNKPLVLEGKDAISTLLIHLILLEPGTYSTKPGMGVGLVSRYRYNDEQSLQKLRSDIKDQIDAYLPEFNAVDVNVYMDKHSPDKEKGNEIVIEISIDGTLYKYETAQQFDNKIGLIDLQV